MVSSPAACAASGVSGGGLEGGVGGRWGDVQPAEAGVLGSLSPSCSLGFPAGVSPSHEGSVAVQQLLLLEQTQLQVVSSAGDSPDCSAVRALAVAACASPCPESQVQALVRREVFFRASSVEGGQSSFSASSLKVAVASGVDSGPSGPDVAAAQMETGPVAADDGSSVPRDGSSRLWDMLGGRPPGVESSWREEDGGYFWDAGSLELLSPQPQSSAGGGACRDGSGARDVLGQGRRGSWEGFRDRAPLWGRSLSQESLASSLGTRADGRAGSMPDVRGGRFAVDPLVGPMSRESRIRQEWREQRDRPLSSLVGTFLQGEELGRHRLLRLWGAMAAHVCLPDVPTVDLSKYGHVKIWAALESAADGLLQVLIDGLGDDAQRDNAARDRSLTLQAVERLLVSRRPRTPVPWPVWMDEGSLVRILQTVRREWMGRTGALVPLAERVGDASSLLEGSAYLAWLDGLVAALRHRARILRQRGVVTDRQSAAMAPEVAAAVAGLDPSVSSLPSRGADGGERPSKRKRKMRHQGPGVRGPEAGPPLRRGGLPPPSLSPGSGDRSRRARTRQLQQQRRHDESLQVRRTIFRGAISSSSDEEMETGAAEDPHVGSTLPGPPPSPRVPSETATGALSAASVPSQPQDVERPALRAVSPPRDDPGEGPSSRGGAVRPEEGRRPPPPAQSGQGPGCVGRTYATVAGAPAPGRGFLSPGRSVGGVPPGGGPEDASGVPGGGARGRAGAFPAAEEDDAETDDPRRRYVLRFRYRGQDAGVDVRRHIVKTLIRAELRFPRERVAAVIHPAGSKEVDVCLVDFQAYLAFLRACRDLSQTRPQVLRDFAWQSMVREATREVQVSFRTSVIAAEDVATWLGHFVVLRAGPEKILDEDGFWTGAFRALVTFPPAGGRRLPKFFYLGGDRGETRYEGQPAACFSCGAFDHRRRDCATPLCAKCGVRGHVAGTCLAALRCNLCQRAGHAFVWCPWAFHNRRSAARSRRAEQMARQGAEDAVRRAAPARRENARDCQEGMAPCDPERRSDRTGGGPPHHRAAGTGSRSSGRGAADALTAVAAQGVSAPVGAEGLRHVSRQGGGGPGSLPLPEEPEEFPAGASRVHVSGPSSFPPPVAHSSLLPPDLTPGPVPSIGLFSTLPFGPTPAPVPAPVLDRGSARAPVHDTSPHPGPDPHLNPPPLPHPNPVLTPRPVPDPSPNPVPHLDPYPVLAPDPGPDPCTDPPPHPPPPLRPDPHPGPDPDPGPGPGPGPGFRLLLSPEQCSVPRSGPGCPPSPHSVFDAGLPQREEWTRPRHRSQHRAEEDAAVEGRSSGPSPGATCGPEGLSGIPWSRNPFAALSEDSDLPDRTVRTATDAALADRRPSVESALVVVGGSSPALAFSSPLSSSPRVGGATRERSGSSGSEGGGLSGPLSLTLSPSPPRSVECPGPCERGVASRGGSR